MASTSRPGLAVPAPPAGKPRRTAFRWFTAGLALLLAAPLAVPAATAVVGAPSGDEYAFTARLDIGDGQRACSGALVWPGWILSAKSCFAEDPAVPVPAGPPASATTATIGRSDLTGTAGQVRQIVKLVPHPERDLVLARLDQPVAGIEPVAIGATAPAPGEELLLPAFGRTATEWSPLRLHTGSFAVDSVAGGDLVLSGQDGAAVCAGDTGGPALKETAGGVELVGVNSRSWQGGCFGTDPAETRTTAFNARTDDIAEWVALGSVMDEWRAFVKAVFKDSLGREATPEEVQGWENNFVGHARNGVDALDRTPDLATAMESSSKYHEARVIDAFESTLEYTPSQAQISNHVAAVRDGTRSLDEVELFLLYHVSYYEHVGGTDIEYLNALYQHILHRAPTQEQVDYWLPRLREDRTAMVRELWDNPVSVRTRIRDAYRHYLDRAPTLERLDQWEERLASTPGRSEAVLRQGLITPGEYYDRASTRY